MGFERVGRVELLLHRRPIITLFKPARKLIVVAVLNADPLVEGAPLSLPLLDVGFEPVQVPLRNIKHLPSVLRRLQALPKFVYFCCQHIAVGRGLDPPSAKQVRCLLSHRTHQCFRSLHVRLGLGKGQLRIVPVLGQTNEAIKLGERHRWVEPNLFCKLRPLGLFLTQIVLRFLQLQSQLAAALGEASLRDELGEFGFEWFECFANCVCVPIWNVEASFLEALFCGLLAARILLCAESPPGDANADERDTDAEHAEDGIQCAGAERCERSDKRKCQWPLCLAARGS